MNRIALITLMAVALAAPAAGAGSPHFVRTVDNPWFPLKTGSVWHYRGVKDGKPSRDVVKVTGRTKTILGVTTTAVSDRPYLSRPPPGRTPHRDAHDARGHGRHSGQDTA